MYTLPFVKKYLAFLIIAGFLIAGTGLFAETANYTYDDMNRLTKVEYGDGTVIGYAYDLAGNRLQEKITTTAKPPKVITGSATSVTATTAKLRGTVNPEGLSTTAWFEYGKKSGSYTKKSKKKKNLTGTADLPVSFTVFRLSPGKKYYYRLAAENEGGASHGSELTFTTLSK